MKKRKKISGILLAVTFVLSMAFGPVPAAASGAGSSAGLLGSVCMGGNAAFDADELYDEAAYDWHWLSTVDSRMAVLPAENLKKNDFHLDMDLFVGMNDKKIRNFQSLTVGGEKAASIDYQWKPYGAIYDGRYSDGTAVGMTEFFHDKDTLLRYYDITGAAEKEFAFTYNGTIEHSGMKDDLETSALDDGSLLMEGPDYYFLFKIMVLDNDGVVTQTIQPQKNGDAWSVKITGTKDTMKIASSVTLAVKYDDATDKTVKQRAKEAVSDRTSIENRLEEVKKEWNDRLAKVPAPTVWGIQGLEDKKGVTEQQHQQSFYAAWAFYYQNIMEPVKENGYNHRQVTLGKTSGYTSGPDGAINSCSWESLYCIQQLAMVEPDIAWDAVKGFIESIPESGKLSGESLPSQKAHTVWTCYENKQDETALKALYPKLRAYLKWRAENPHWIIGGREFSDEKDISFVTQWYSDVNYAIKICEALGEQEDIAMWDDMKREMAENAKQWFFSEEGTIHNWYFSDSGKYYDHDRMEDVDNYIISALNAEFPKELTDRVVAYFLEKVYKPEEDLVGLDFYKYGDGCQIAYGLFEKEAAYPKLQGVWKKQINSVLRHVLKTGEFCEECRPGQYNTSGVAPSTFNASAVIDFTYMNNGLRMDEGSPVLFDSIGDGWTLAEDNLEFSALKGAKVSLPKTVAIKRTADTETQNAYVVWQGTDAIDNMTPGTYAITGKVAGTELTVNAKVYIYDGSLTVPPVVSKTVENTLPQLPQATAVSWQIGNKTYYGYTKIAWDEMDASEFKAGRPVEVKGRLTVNDQEIKAAVTVIDAAIASATGNFTVNQGESLQLSVKDSQGEALEVTEWKIKDSTYDNKIGINQKGKVIGAEPGTAVVLAVLDGQLQIEKEITVLAKNVVSLAYGSIITASQEADTARTADKAVDEDTDTMWRSKTTDGNQKVELDLGQTSLLEGINVLWCRETVPDHFTVEVSADKESWSKQYERTGRPDDKKQDYSETMVFDEPVEVRYIRINLVKAGANVPGIVEIRAYGNVVEPGTAGSVAIASETGAFEITEKARALQLTAKVEGQGLKDHRVIWSVAGEDGKETDLASVTATGRVIPKDNGKVTVTAVSVLDPALKDEKTVTITNQEYSNVALHQKVTATSNGGGENIPESAVDGDRSTRWGSASGAPQASHLTIHFDQTYLISSAKLYFEAALPVDYKLQYSASQPGIAYDEIKWQDLENVTGNNSQEVMYTFAPVKANYVRIISSKTTNQEWCYSVFEFEVYGEEVDPVYVEELHIVSETGKNEIAGKGKELRMAARISPAEATNQKLSWRVCAEDGTDTDIAVISDDGVLTPLKDGKVRVTATAEDRKQVSDEVTVTIKNQARENLAVDKANYASSQDGEHIAGHAVDGDAETRWASRNGDNEYYTIDLNDQYYVNQVILNWEDAYGKQYKIEGSLDRETYQELYREENGDGGIDNIVFEETLVRYIRMQGIKRATEWGYSLWEFEVYGQNAKENLAQQYDQYKELDGSLYTADSFAALQAALEDVKVVLENPNATAEEIQAANKKLQSAVAGLKEKPADPKPVQADKSKLNQMIAKAGEISGKDYTAESWQKLAEVLGQAKALAAREDAAQDAVDAMTASLKAAIDALVKKPTDDKPTGDKPADDKPSGNDPSGNIPSDNNPTVKKISKAVLSKTSCTYNGKQQKPGVTVYDGKKKLKVNKDYTLSYKNNKTVGTASVTVKGKGAYTGTVTKKFSIVPRGTSLSGKITAKSKGFTVKWKKVKSVTGYQIQYSTSKKFTKKTTVAKSVKKASTIKWTAKKLKSKKTYYVRVRAYQKVKGKTYYAAWSKAKTVKTKK